MSERCKVPMKSRVVGKTVKTMYCGKPLPCPLHPVAAERCRFCGEPIELSMGVVREVWLHVGANRVCETQATPQADATTEGSGVSSVPSPGTEADNSALIAELDAAFALPGSYGTLAVARRAWNALRGALSGEPT